MHTEKFEAPIVEQPAEATGDAPRPKRTNGRVWLIIAIIAVMLICLRWWGARSRSVAQASGETTVAAAEVTREDLFNEVAIPAEFRPYVEVELHAKVSGFLEQMKVDFGDKVKAGQLLATLEVPELQDQLHSARAMEQRAAADYTNAHVMYGRLQQVNQEHSNLVAQQDLDTAQARDSSALAAIESAKADVEKYETLEKYTRITAPFDGVVTKRYADPGTLIQSGTASETQSLPLVRLSDNYHLRLDFPVSVKYVKDTHPGQTVEVKVDSLEGRTFTGKITRFTGKLNEDTRTMMTEIEVDNADLQIVPGMYAEVVLKVGERLKTLAIPVQAVSGEKETTVYVINAQHEIESRAVKVGLETPEKYEVVSGLKEGELVMIGNRSLVHPGEKVEMKLITQKKP